GRRLVTSGGVEIATDRLDLLCDLACRAPCRSLERHVFEQVGYPVLIRPLVAAAGAHPDPERGGLEVRHRVGDDGQTGGKTGDSTAHAPALPRAARLEDGI